MYKLSPKIAIRTSMSNYKKENNLVDLPLYAIDNLCKTLRSV